MAIPTYLSKIKSSGIYRYVFDRTELSSSTEQSLRLVVGACEQGPFNTPVYFDSKEEFVKVFGPISRRMERKGVFFNRLAQQALDGGPILALNLKPFDQEYTKMLTFNASDLKLVESSVITVSNNFFAKNTDGTYTKLSAYANGCYARHCGSYYPVSVSDGKYKITVPAFAQADLKDDTDDSTGIMKGALVAYDTTGASGKALGTIYDTNRFWKITDNLFNIKDVHVDSNGDLNITNSLGSTAQKDYMRIVQTSSKEDSVTVFIRPYTPAGYHLSIEDWYTNETDYQMPGYMNSIKDHFLDEYFAEIYVFKGDFRSAKVWDYTGSLGTYPLGTNIPSDADASVYRAAWMPFCTYENGTLRTNANWMDAWGNYGDALQALADCETSNLIGHYQGIMFPEFYDANGTCISLDVQLNADYEAHKLVMQFNAEMLDDAYDMDLNGDGIYDGTKDFADGESSSLEDPNGVAHKGVASYVHALASCLHNIKTGEDGVEYEDYEEKVLTDEKAESIVGYYLEGYQYQAIDKTMDGKDLVEAYCSVLQYKGIFEALTNSVDCEWHYLIDTFQGYPTMAMKADLASICKKKFNTLGILNFPPMIDCMRQVGEVGSNGGFDMQKIVKGTSGISLPSESQGASFVAFYTQLKYNDGSYTYNIPSAALVSNLYMLKYSQYQPYDIIAGTNKGVITYRNIVGPDYNYARADMDALEPFGVNVISYIPRYGIVINSQQTAKQTPVTALSKVHVRELTTYIQDTIEHMLRAYWWELNTASLRATVKARADAILEVVLGNGGIYAYRTVCDDTNNTPEMIDNEIMLLDVEIEPARGTGKIVQTLTLRKTGALS